MYLPNRAGKSFEVAKKLYHYTIIVYRATNILKIYKKQKSFSIILMCAFFSSLTKSKVCFLNYSQILQSYIQDGIYFS